jgi:hypothetical protein
VTALRDGDTYGIMGETSSINRTRSRPQQDDWPAAALDPITWPARTPPRSWHAYKRLTDGASHVTTSQLVDVGKRVFFHFLALEPIGLGFLRIYRPAHDVQHIFLAADLEHFARVNFICRRIH